MRTNMFSDYKYGILLFFIASFSLAFAFVSEYVFDLTPCILCIYQRMPYFALIFLALGILTMSYYKRSTYIFQKTICIIWFFSSLLALYHVGVEQHVFPMPTECSHPPSLSRASSSEELQRLIYNRIAVRCDVPAWTFLGVSMAGWNALWSLLWMMVTYAYYRRSYRHSFVLSK
jgi:disulfide bond formation protein DsbB